ncbi:MAG: transposase family protein [Moorea sp. SIO3C2]|nr:transposase family protein [Moorena sp. SIO3C2]
MSRGFNSSFTPKNKQTSQSKINKFLSTSFFQHFATLSDPRIDRSKEHLLIDILAIAILAVISGAEGWVGIETYGKAKHEWLKEFL